MKAAPGKTIQLISKIVLSLACLYLVYHKIDLVQLRKELKYINFFYLLLAIVFFILSKIISSFRLNYFFKAIDISLPNKENLKLYWLGMFYNLFLPGGIGGDGYKVYLLNKRFHVSIKRLISAVFIDRISGLLALGSAALVLALFTHLSWHFYWRLGLIVFIPLMYIIYRVIIKNWFPHFLKIINITNLQGVYVQCMQLISIIFILLSLHTSQHYAEYLLIFLVSSMVAVLPLTIGGIGARELVFLYGSQWLLLDEHTSIAISLLFFTITAATSLFGIIYVIRDT